MFPSPKRPFVSMLDTASGHYYQDKSGTTYPSITTVQKAFPEPEGLTIWKQRTPNWKEISESSMKVGTEMHHMAEEYLNGRPVKIREGFEIDMNILWTPLKKHLDDHITNVKCTETPLYSPLLYTAGTVDLVADYDGVPSIIDFKNARRPKTPGMVKNSGYPIQLTAYAYMVDHCFGEHIESLYNIVVSWDGKVRAFHWNREDWDGLMWQMLVNYEEILNSS